MSMVPSLQDQANHIKLHRLTNSRLRLAIFALVFEILISILFFKSGTFPCIIGFFNSPAIIALSECVLRRSYKLKKHTRVLLRVGVAKMFGGLLLAIYIAIKVCSTLDTAGSSSKMALRVYAVCVGVSLLADLAYTAIALMILRRSRKIVRILRRKEYSERKRMTPSSPTATENSTDSCSVAEERGSDELI